MRQLEQHRPNRAVTAFYQVFGGRWKRLPGEAVHMAEGEGHHRAEWRVLSLLVPLVSGAAVFDALWRLGGPWLAWAGVLPATFLVLHVLAFVLGGKDAPSQWRRWDLLLTAWTLWQLFLVPESGVAWAMYLWIAVVLLNAFAFLPRAWRWLMTHPALCTTNVRWGIALLVHTPAVAVGWKFGWPWGIACLPVLGAIWCCGTFLPNSRMFGPVARRTEEREILLTIDDGPDPEDTPALLDLLDQHGRKAVFFVIGEKVRRFPELAREIVRRGHELGNHTMTHPAGTFWCAGSARTRREIAECSRAIEEVTGRKPRWFRAPAGHRNWFTHPVLRELGLELVGWRKRAYDTIRRDVDGIVRDLTDGTEPADILLLHEATPVAKEVMVGVLRGVSSK